MDKIRKKATTIYDIAESTSLSAATVSRVLNGKDNISIDTREKVMEAVKKMNYYPNYAARSLKTRTTNQILLSIPHLNSAFYTDLIESVQQIAIARNYSLILNHTYGSAKEELKLLRNIKENQVDGLILISINFTKKHIEEVKKINCPVVLSGIGMNHLDEEFRNSYDYVGVDTRQGLFLSTEHLIKQGHTSIGYIGLPLDTQTGQERFDGFEMAMKKWGVQINPQYVICGGYTMNFGYDAGKILLNNTDLPTAIATTCDHICLGLYMAFEEKSIRIPEDIALIGMDNIETSAIVKPKLSSVAIASAEIGRVAGDLIFKRLDGWDAKKQDIIFDPRLIIRESSLNIKK